MRHFINKEPVSVHKNGKLGYNNNSDSDNFCCSDSMGKGKSSDSFRSNKRYKGYAFRRERGDRRNCRGGSYV